MENKEIPTAKEYLEKVCSYYEKTFEPDGDKLYLGVNVRTVMKAFAELHVEKFKQLAEQYSNDQELGEAVRKLINN